MARQVAPPAEPKTERPKDDWDIEEEAAERAALADLVAFSFADQPVRIREFEVKEYLADDEDEYARLVVKLESPLTGEQAETIPHIGPGIRRLLETSSLMPEDKKDTTKTSFSREFAESSYRLHSSTAGRVEFNGEVVRTPSVKVVHGGCTLAWAVKGVVRDGDLLAVVKMLKTGAKLTVEPPQQELDFGGDD